MHAASPAGFWIRALAAVIDVVVIVVAQATYTTAAALVFGAGPDPSMALSSTVGFFTLVFAALYTSVLHATAGQTIGKMMTGVCVVTLDGEPPVGGAAFLRWLGYFVSCATFGLGFVMAGLRTDKRALHDLIAGTRVERVARRAARPPVEPTPPPTPPVVTGRPASQA